MTIPRIKPNRHFQRINTVAYTHLDVYKRQVVYLLPVNFLPERDIERDAATEHHHMLTDHGELASERIEPPIPRVVTIECDGS